MKIQIASDLHLEHVERLRIPGFRVVEPAPEAELLVLAGDIHRHTQALATFADWPVPVLYIIGNHESYGHHYLGLIDKLRAESPRGAVRFLELARHVQDRVRFLGATLWTDYALYGQSQQLNAMAHAQQCLNDHRVISMTEGTFTTHHALARHERSRQWLAQELATPFDGKTVVISHHGPHANSVHPKYGNDPLNAAFNSDLSPLLEQADLWIHGHVHDSFDYQVGRCRVVANPRGYPRTRYAEAVNEIQWENPAFNPQCVVEI